MCHGGLSVDTPRRAGRSEHACRWSALPTACCGATAALSAAHRTAACRWGALAGGEHFANRSFFCGEPPSLIYIANHAEANIRNT